MVFVLIGAIGLAPAPRVAQPTAPTTSESAALTPQSDVVVRAPQSQREIRAQTERFVRSYAAAANPEIDQIGRWRDAVCVRIVGMPSADQGAKIRGRIETVARSVGLPAASPNCRPNVEVVFSREPQAAMDFVARRRESILGYHHRTRRNELKLVSLAMQAWYVTSTHSNSLDAGVLAFSGVSSQPDNDVVDDPENPPPSGCAGSVLLSCYTSEFLNVFIVADSTALEGAPLGAIADQMAMLALSQPRSLGRCNPLPSVMDRLARIPCAGRTAPVELTPADAAYLTALYSTDPQARREFQEREISDAMARILAAARSEPSGGATGAPPQ